MSLCCPTPLLISTADQLIQSAETWEKAKTLAVDTEFMRTNTFYPYLGLIQISDGEHCWLIDPLAEIDLSPVKELLVNPNIIKLFHSCSEDLDVLSLTFDVLPSPLVDTQIAAAIAGIGFGMGYNRLLNELLDINLDKHQTRSDWLQRPLSDDQLLYAAEDVYFLFHMYPIIEAKLESQGRQKWLEEDMDRLLNIAATPSNPEEYYVKVKSAWRLQGDHLAALQALCIWRENEARLRNKPRGHILKDEQLLGIAHQLPQDKNSLSHAGKMHPGQVRRYGDLLLSLISPQALGEKPPLEPLASPMDKTLRDLAKKIKQKIANVAETEDIPKEILAAKRDIEQLLHHGLDAKQELDAKYQSGWRGTLVNQAVASVFKSDQPTEAT